MYFSFSFEVEFEEKVVLLASAHNKLKEEEKEEKEDKEGEEEKNEEE